MEMKKRMIAILLAFALTISGSATAWAAPMDGTQESAVSEEGAQGSIVPEEGVQGSIVSEEGVQSSIVPEEVVNSEGMEKEESEVGGNETNGLDIYEEGTGSDGIEKPSYSSMPESEEPEDGTGAPEEEDVDGELNDIEPQDIAAENENGEELFAGGNGTAEDPYQITTAEQMNNVRKNLSASYVLMNDIDLSGYSNWEPIGTSSEIPFVGIFDGNNHTITGLTITEAPTVDDNSVPVYVGLFGFCKTEYEHFFCRNLKMENASINIHYDEENPLYIGTVSGCSDGFLNCETKGKIVLTGNIDEISVGGIVGAGVVVYNEIQSCKNYVDINIENNAKTGHIYCGGISGKDGEVTDCVNYGSIIVNSENMLLGSIGGICGEATANISRCVNYGNITGYVNGRPDYYSYYEFYFALGGIIGQGELGGETLESCVNYGDITGDLIHHPHSRCYVAGIMGKQRTNYHGNWSGPYSVSKCFNKGNITSSEFAYRIYPCTGYIKECYSLDSALINGVAATEDIGADKPNGANLSEEEINKRIKELFGDRNDDEAVPITPQNGFLGAYRWGSNYKVKFNKSITDLGEGTIFFYDKATGQKLLEVKKCDDSDNSGTCFMQDKEGDVIIINIISRDALPNDRDIYITLSEDVVKFVDGTVNRSYSSPEFWYFHTFAVDTVAKTNGGVKGEISDDKYNLFFTPLMGRWQKLISDGKKGICFGMCYTTIAWENNYKTIHGIVQESYLSKADVDRKTADGLSLLDYMQYAHIYQFTSKVQKSEITSLEDLHKKMIDYLLNNGEPIIIRGWNWSNKGHALLPVSIEKNEDNSCKILLYNCNNSDADNIYCYLEMNKNSGSWKNWEIKQIDSSSGISEILYKTGDEISCFTLDDIGDVAIGMSSNGYKEEKSLLVTKINNFTLDGKEYYQKGNSNGNILLPITFVEAEETAEQSDNMYWTDATKLTIDSEDEEFRETTLCDGYKEFTVEANVPAEVTIDLNHSNTVSAQVRKDGTIRIQKNIMDGESIKNTTIIGEVKTGKIILSETDSGYTIEGITSLDISVDGINQNLSVKDMDNNEKYQIVIREDSITIDKDGKGDNDIDKVITSTKKKPIKNENINQPKNDSQIIDVKKEEDTSGNKKATSDDGKDTALSQKAPGTGDSSCMIFWSILMLCGIFCFTISYTKWRKLQK